MAAATGSDFRLTEHLLSISEAEYKAATQAPFLVAAGEGRLSKTVLSTWLANDRLYIHAYIRAVGALLSTVDLPAAVPVVDAPETQLVDWLIEALAAVRREERLFLDVAQRYELDVGLETIGAAEAAGAQPRVNPEAKLAGLTMIEDTFASIPGRDSLRSMTGGVAATLEGPASPIQLPWLEGAIVLWGTERVYLDAWSFARAKQPALGQTSADEDADGGALRREFIPNWSSLEFSNFVARLGGLIDYAVQVVVERTGEKARDDILQRVEGKWKSLLAAETAFWPQVE